MEGNINQNCEVFGGNPNKTEKVSPFASVSTLYDIMHDILFRFRDLYRASVNGINMETIPGAQTCVLGIELLHRKTE